MKLKKICATILSGILLVGGMTSIVPNEKEVLAFEPISITAESISEMRRPCNNENPMFIVHIDTWNYADPAKIIQLIPEDIRPYCVFNISLSINWNNTNHNWLMVQDGYECAKSWLRACADEGIWCMVQPASGGQCHFPDYDSSGNLVNFPNKSQFATSTSDDYEDTIYAEFFRDYPNFIGFNYSEQFWGFESLDFPITPLQRYEHFSKLLALCNKYGGFLNINWCANQWSAGLNPIAMLKTCPEWKNACEKYSDNLQLSEKYTQLSFIEDVESEIFGAYVSGYCGNFGVRYDESGWSDSTWNGTGEPPKEQYRQITGLPIHLERMALNGATIIDGPELVWLDDFGEKWGGSKDSEGYTSREWEIKDQYFNATLDFFRKVIDGTVKIPDRQEVIDRTKVVVIQDVNSGTNHNKYSTYPTLFEGLYRMPDDGNYEFNHNPYKSTGRYPTIPTVYALKDDVAKSFQVQINQSQIDSRWSSIEAKQEEFNKLFASDYYGNCYVGRNKNTWLAYNSNKDGSNCGAVLSLKYNSCKNLDVNLNAYGNALINEYSDKIDIYANNFDEKSKSTLQTDTFKISGCSSKPSYTAKDTGINQTKSQITESYEDGVYTLKVQHNGPVSISIQCSGNETNRLVANQIQKLTPPVEPAFYTGTRQYEGELFDVKNVEGIVTNACNSGVTGVQGQGFLKFGKNSTAQARDTVRTQKAGEFTLKLRYSSTSNVNNVDLFVNDIKVETMNLSNTNGYSNWKVYEKNITLKEGDNKIEFKANSELSASLYIDNFTVDGVFGDENIPVIEPINGNLIKNLVVEDRENASDWSIGYDFGIGSVVYGDRDFTCISSSIFDDGAEYIKTACDSKLYTNNLATFDAGKDMYVYVALDNRIPLEYAPWLNDWTKTNVEIIISTDVTFTLFQKQVSAGEKITLGTNGGLGLSANYIVLASTSLPKIEEEGIYLRGDANCDGIVTVADVVAAAAVSAEPSSFALSKQGVKNADVHMTGDGVSVTDASIIQEIAIGLEQELQPEPEPNITPEEYMAQVSASIVELEPEDSKAEVSGVQYGTFEKITFNSAVCGGRNKDFNVLLPANYDDSKQYPVLYALHGYWGDEDSLLDGGDPSLRLRQIIGNAIATGDAKEMIVVFPDIYASDIQDSCDGLNDKNNKAYDNFINVLTKEIMPYMEQNYSIKTGRDNTAITGFSMGGRESLYIGISRTDLFGYVGAVCPAPGLTTDLIPAENLKFGEVSPKLLMISAGSNDEVVWSTPADYHNALNNNNTTHVWHYVIGGGHYGNTIRPHIYNFIRYIF